MSTDPDSGIALLTMFKTSGGALTDGSQFSGVLIAPDEILTVAHGVVASDGTFLNSGTAYLGHDGDGLAGGVAITAMHVLDTTHRAGGVETDSLVASDFAVAKLATPVTSATTFALGLGSPGTYTITGYPAVARGARTSVSEALGHGYATGELSGGEILPGQDGAGASGSPVFDATGDVSTVHGLYTADDGAGHGEMTSLTQSDIDQIKAWVYADDAGDSWGAAFAPAPLAPQPGSSTIPPTPVPAPVDGLDRLAASLRAASASEPAPKALMSNDVATGLHMAASRGLSDADLPDAAFGTAAILRRTSWTPRKSVAYMAGLLAGEAGVARGRVLGYVANVFGLSVPKTLDRVVMAGYADDAGLGSAVASAPIAGTEAGGWTARDLGAALGQPGTVATAHDHAWVGHPAEVGHILLEADQGAHGPRRTGSCSHAC